MAGRWPRGIQEQVGLSRGSSDSEGGRGRPLIHHGAGRGMLGVVILILFHPHPTHCSLQCSQWISQKRKSCSEVDQMQNPIGANRQSEPTKGARGKTLRQGRD